MTIAVIGAGAAGLAAAIAAAEAGARVTVLEKAQKPGKKILATGNGRCNLMNTGRPRYPGGGEMAVPLIEKNKHRLPQLLHSWGLTLNEEADGRVYPACGQAKAVLQVLLLQAESAGVRFMYGEAAKEITRQENGYLVHLEEKKLYADKVILCCGGMAGKNLGHDGSAYQLYTRLGHHMVKPSPSLTGIETDKKAIKGLSGLRCPAILHLVNGQGTVCDQSSGEILFTDFGISGICTMQLSRTVGMILNENPMIYADLSPLLGLAQRRFTHPEKPEGRVGEHLQAVKQLLNEREKQLGRERMLAGLLPDLLFAKLKDEKKEELAKLLSAYPLRVTGLRGFDQAQVTAGGLKTDEFDPSTMESRLCPGLYAAGEVLDVDGDCGGFNLQFAFISGFTAGENAAIENI